MSNPMTQLQRGYRVALGLSVVGFYFITSWLLEDPANPGSSFKFFLCGIVGMLCAYIIVLSTQYYTDYEYRPVQSIAEASTTGHGTNIIVGISVGMKATFVPSITVACAVLTAYHLGASTGEPLISFCCHEIFATLIFPSSFCMEGIGDGRNAGLFGTAVATMGELDTAQCHVPRFCLICTHLCLRCVISKVCLVTQCTSCQVSSNTLCLRQSESNATSNLSSFCINSEQLWTHRG